MKAGAMPLFCDSCWSSEEKNDISKRGEFRLLCIREGRRVEFPFLEEILERSGRKIRSSFP